MAKKENKLKTWSMMLLVAMMMPLMVACGGDDDDDISSFKSYIIGTWFSYKADFGTNGNSQTVDVSMTGENSAYYYICEIKDGGEAVLKAWEVDFGGNSYWAAMSCTYRIKGYVVTLTDNSGRTYDFVFDPSSRNLVLTSSSSYNDTLYTLNVYLMKWLK